MSEFINRLAFSKCLVRWNGSFTPQRGEHHECGKYGQGAAGLCGSRPPAVDRGGAYAIEERDAKKPKIVPSGNGAPLPATGVD